MGYDFVYLPIKFGAGTAFGYAFVNLVSPTDAVHFKAHFNGFERWGVPGAKAASVDWSESKQGLAQNIERYRNSPLMHESTLDELRTIIFQNGVRVPFPPALQELSEPSKSSKSRLSKRKKGSKVEAEFCVEPVPSADLALSRENLTLHHAAVQQLLPSCDSSVATEDDCPTQPPSCDSASVSSSGHTQQRCNSVESVRRPSWSDLTDDSDDEDGEPVWSPAGTFVPVQAPASQMLRVGAWVETVGLGEAATIIAVDDREGKYRVIMRHTGNIQMLKAED